MSATTRILTAGVLAITLLTTVVPPAIVMGSTTTCRIRNVTQKTAGTSFLEMVARARWHDTLELRGRCASGAAVVDRSLTVRGAGPAPELVGPPAGWVMRIGPKAGVRVQGVTVRSRAEVRPDLGGDDHWVGGAILNLGWLELEGVTVSKGPLSSQGSLVVSDSSASLIVNDGVASILESIVNHVTNNGAVTMVDSIVAGGVAIDQGVYMNGGGLDNGGSGVAMLIGTRIMHNQSEAGSAGGIWNAGSMTLVDSVVSGNVAGEYTSGGGISNAGHLILVRTIIDQNTADESGGGIDNQGVLMLSDSDVHGNRSDEGGGINNTDPGTVTLLGTSAVTDNDPDDCAGTTAC